MVNGIPVTNVISDPDICRNENGSQERISARLIHVPDTLYEAMQSPQWAYWKDAMGEEMNSINSHETFEYVPHPAHAKIIPLK